MVVLYILYPSSQLPIVRSLAGETVDHFLCEFNTPPSTGVFTHYMGILTPSNFPHVSSIAVSCLLQNIKSFVTVQRRIFDISPANIFNLS